MARRITSFLKKQTKGTALSFGGMVKRFFLKTGFVLIMLGLMTYAVYQCVQHMTVGLDTLRTQEITEESYTALRLFVFRNEEALASGGDVVAYRVADGERVGVGATLATVYTCPDGQDAGALQDQLTQLALRMAAVDNPVGAARPEAGDDLLNAIDQCYLALLEASAAGNAGEALALSKRLEEHLNDYAALTDGAGQGGGAMATLKSLQAALEQSMTAVGNVKTDRSGYFYYRIDGYENVFDVSLVDTMTPAEFLTMTTTSAGIPDRPVAGKMVYTPTWYAAAYVDLADVATFQDGVGQTYTVTVNDGSDTRIPLTLMRVEPDANGALLVFRSQAMPDGFDFPRSFTAVTKTDSVSGYRIPTDALVELNDGEMGVYVLEGNVVELRRVMLKARYDGYVVVETYETVQAIMESLDEATREEINPGDYAYLKLNDRIITRGTGLYEGKLVG